MERLLNSIYKEPERPYSQNELREVRERNLGRIRVGSTMASHERCLHFYFAKEGGKKETRMIETDGADPGYCSVCWKLKKTPPELREKALELLEEYQLRFGSCPERWTHYQVELEKTFYRWLYYEPDRRKKRNNEDQSGRAYRRADTTNDQEYSSTVDDHPPLVDNPTEGAGSDVASGQNTESCTELLEPTPTRRWEALA